jgi:hypothetical protein
MAGEFRDSGSKSRPSSRPDSRRRVHARGTLALALSLLPVPILALFFLATAPADARRHQDPTPPPEPTVDPSVAHEARKPDDFAIVFTLGYGGDLLPQDPETFEAVMAQVAAGGFNVVLASHEDWRLPILERNELKLMVDLLDSRHHVYKNLEGAEALATSLRGDRRVWGYHLFSDTTASVVAGRDRDNENVHLWDPSHPTFAGMKQDARSRLGDLRDPDAVGYYDYHWVRDRDIHFPNLRGFAAYADQKDAALYRWVWVQNGRAGIGNPNRSRYTVFSSLAFGLDGVLWFIGQQMMDTNTWQWNQFGLDTISVNLEVAALGPEMRGLNRIGTWSTEVTINANNDPRDPEAPPIPPGLDAIPEDLWVQVEAGEVILAHFQDEAFVDHVYLANHTSYAAQQITLTLEVESPVVEMFNRGSRVWTEIPLVDGRLNFELGAGYGELFRVPQTPIEPTPTPEPDLPPLVAQPIDDVDWLDDGPPTTSIDLSAVFTDPDDDDAAIVKAVESNSNRDLVNAIVAGDQLTLVFTPDMQGEALIVIRADSDGQTVDDSFTVRIVPNDQMGVPVLLPVLRNGGA